MYFNIILYLSVISNFTTSYALSASFAKEMPSEKGFD